MHDKDNVLKLFGYRIRQIRKERGLSQESLAAICKLDRTYIGGVERGERNVSLRNIDIIARALDVTMSELMKDL
jgi:transcriptional regulator with XRE-family HTH domain